MSAAARSRGFQDPIENALAALEEFDDLTMDPNKAAKNTDDIRLKTNRINKLLRSPQIDRVTRPAIRRSLTRFVGAVHAYLEFEDHAPPPRGLSSAALRQLATNRSKVWTDMRNTADQLLSDLDRP